MIRNSGKHPGRLLPDGLVFRLDPTAPVPCQVGQILLARGPVNQADDVCPHDATPLLIRGQCIEGMFPAGFAASGKWFRARDAAFQFRFGAGLLAL
jgi:hypothetical protein